MANYLGRNPAVGTQRMLDSLESQFDGALATFDLRYNGTPTYPTLSESLIVSLGGVLQEPGEAYYVSSDKIVFSEAPNAGTECWILLYSQYGATASSTPSLAIQATGEPMGFEDRTHSIIRFDNGSRTFSIAPNTSGGYSSYVVWTKGTKRTITTTQSVQVGTSTGLYYIYFDAFGDLQYKTTYFTWDTETPVAYVYWNATTSSAPFVADERHGIVLDWATHEYLHRTRGAVIAEGFGISNYTTAGDGNANADAQFDLANGTFFDEDLEVAISHSASPTVGTFTQVLTGAAEIPVFYMSGADGAWVRDAATEYACKQSATTLQYNLLSGGTWSTTSADNNRYVVSWVVATNEINAPIIAILGQDQYSSIGEAEAEVFGNLTLTNFPIVEFRPLWKVIFQTSSGYANTPNARIANVLDLRQLSGTGEAGTVVSDHGLLSGLADDDHSQYLHTTLTRAGITSSISTSGDLGGANLTLTGELRGPANFVIDPAAVGDNTGTVEIKGNLTVQGTTTTVNSTTTTVNQISLGDNDKALFGDGNDLEIFHNGTDSYIRDLGAGDLRLVTDGAQISLNKFSGGEPLANFIPDGAVELYYDNSLKFQTTATGVTITGDALLTGGSRTLTVSSTGAGFIKFAGGNSSVAHNSNQLQFITSQVQGITFITGSEERLRVDAAGNARLYESGANGNSRELNFEVYGGTATEGNGVINFKRSRSYIADTQAPVVNNILGQIKFSGSNGTSFVEGARIEAKSFSTWNETDSATDLIFYTTPDNSTTLTEVLRIKYDGNVGIGTDAPGAKLDVNGNAKFADTINVGGLDLSDTNANGIEVRASGELMVQRSSNQGTSAVLDIRLGNTQTVNILGNGRATFNNVISATSSSGSAGTNSVLNIGTYNSNNSYVGAYNTNATKVQNSPSIFVYDRTTPAYKMRVWQDGSAHFASNVGIGNDNPQSKLQIENAGEQLRLTYPSIASYIHEVKSNGDYAIDKDGTERLRITSGGTVQIGNPTERTKLGGNYSSKLQVEGTDFDTARISIISNSTNNSLAPQLVLGKTSTADINSIGAVEDTEAFGAINFMGSDGTFFREGALIEGRADGTVSSGVVPGSLRFYTSNSSGNRTEGLRITSSGNVGIGTTNPQAKLDVAGNVQPSADATHDLGSPTARWANIYSADLQLSNEGSPTGNDIDGTWGAYTIQEGEEELFLINRRSGKKFKFVLEEVK